ncbi:MAG: flagellar biosynthesis protein FlhF [Clostridiales bacterium]|nr:flagellar biosynthesis protein FlhF [Clostridiales bacterium]
MTIKKFQGKTEEEATLKAKQELGVGTVIMNVKEVKPKGLFKAFKNSTYEVTAAIEENEKTAQVKAPEMPKVGKIDVSADEAIRIPAPEPVKKEEPKEQIKETSQTVENMWASLEEKMKNETKKEVAAENNLEEKLESLQNFLEKKLAPEETKKEELLEEPEDEGFKFMKMIYSVLLENEVDEKYVNQIIDEVETVRKKGSSVDHMLSSIYQKMILKFGQPQPIELAENAPKLVFFVGPTGVGKTTTIAKIASRFKVEKGKKVALLTADTYRIAAADQLRTYANILDTPIKVIYSLEELNDTLKEWKDYDLILIDTAGLSHKNEEQRNDIKNLITGASEEYEKEIYLVLSATTKYRDLKDIVDVYQKEFKVKLIFTKLDETNCYGNMLNMKLYTGADLSYVTYGQNVPEDIEVFNMQKIVKILLGGK